ncbi:hypothetical protein [Sagittula salina]|uniref:Uncharacterized protein n=1 Tax=Sagittula salina TaxID=2820268 RepID=A0A940S1T9_9RHOB|nr:hypothetical protein [Sagittula salina]MBP0484518.1 hypothetical protein [Sagittula salina]
MTLITPILPADTPRTAAEAALARYVLNQADALLSASALLGGEPAERRTARLLRDLLHAPRLTRRLRREFVDLHRLLSLDGVEDPESLQAGCFAAIDPSSPVVEDICLLADGVRAHLVALAEAGEDDPALSALMAA